MKQVKDMPATGQFIVVSDYNEEQWASTHKWIDGDLYCYDEVTDEFLNLDNNDPEDGSDANNIKYFVFDGEK